MQKLTLILFILMFVSSASFAGKAPTNQLLKKVKLHVNIGASDVCYERPTLANASTAQKKCPTGAVGKTLFTKDVEAVLVCDNNAPENCMGGWSSQPALEYEGHKFFAHVSRKKPQSKS